MVNPTMTRLPAQVQKSLLSEVIKLPASKVARQVK